MTAISSTLGLGAGDHACWAFGSTEEFGSVAASFLADGLSAGARVMYLGDGPVSGLLAHLDSLGDAESLVAAGSLEVVAAEDQYGNGGRLDVGAALAGFQQAAADAVSAGYSGLRAAADTTRFVLTPHDLDDFGGTSSGLGAGWPANR